MSELTDKERALLDIEARSWTYAGRKEAAVLDATGWSMTRAMQVLNRLIDTEAGLAYKPTLVNRLRRVREQRQRSRPVRRVERD